MARASDQRRLAAALDWDPYYGDRHTRLAFIGGGFDAVDLHRRLATCLLTDDELAAGLHAWTKFAGPFAGCFATPDPTGDNPRSTTTEGTVSHEA